MAVFSTVLPTWLIAESIRRIGANTASLVGSLGPVFTIGFGALLLGEPSTCCRLVGAALVLAGVMLVSRVRPAQAASTARAGAIEARAVDRAELSARRSRPRRSSHAPDTLERSTLALKDPSLLRQQCYVDGQWIDADDGGTMPVVNPATGVPVGTVPVFGAAETKRAIEAANRAWPAWRAKTAKERSAILRKWYDLMLANVDDLALHPHHRAGQAARRGEGRDRRSAPRTSSGSPRKRSASTAT